MPVSKKPKKKAAATPRRKKEPPFSAADLASHRAAVEQMLSGLGGEPDAALGRAQDLMYEAWGLSTSKQRIAAAQKALQLSPLCADAYNLLAAEAPTPEAALECYAKGLEAGEKALGPDGFEEYAGEFWGFLETRPYMRARAGVVTSLIALGRQDEAIEHLRAMLDLNPGDNQGMRYILLQLLLERDDIAAVKALFAAYDDEWSPQFLYTKCLIAFREGHADAAETHEVLRQALETNRHVPGKLASKTKPGKAPPALVAVGGPAEAAMYVEEFGAAWHKTPGAVEWLSAAVKTVKA